MEKVGIKNLKPVVALAIEMGNVADVMGRTKGVARFMALTALMDEAMAINGVDFKAVKAEIKDLDSAEKDELNAFIAAKFDIASDKLEGIIEEAVDLAADIYDVGAKAIALVKKAKGE